MWGHFVIVIRYGFDWASVLAFLNWGVIASVLSASFFSGIFTLNSRSIWHWALELDIFSAFSFGSTNSLWMKYCKSMLWICWFCLKTSSFSSSLHPCKLSSYLGIWLRISIIFSPEIFYTPIMFSDRKHSEEAERLAMQLGYL